MAYDTECLMADAKAAIKAHNLMFIRDITAYIGINNSTFYDHFPKDSDGYKELAAMTQVNKIKTKNSLKKKWFDLENPSGWKHLYALIGTEKEVARLHGSKKEVDLKSGGKPLRIEFAGGDMQKLLDLITK